MIELEVVRLGSPGVYARPKGTLGSCGWSPFPWSMVHGRTADEARRKFYATHKHYLSSLGNYKNATFITE